MSRRFAQVDVFGAAQYEGNPVAVILDAEGMDDETMRAFSVWSNLSECTFVLPPTEPTADYRVRIFNLRLEIPFAGHPTLGTARAWLDAGGVPMRGDTVVQQCDAGLVPIRIDGDELAFTAPPLLRSGPVEPALLGKLIAILGVEPARVVDAAWLDNGPGWVGVLLDSAETVLNLRPDVSDHPGRWDIGVVGRHPVRAEAAFELRAFFTDGHEPLREDPVTGSLNAAAAQWLLDTGRATAPFLSTQGAAVGRRGRITISQEDAELRVGGHARTLITGVITA